MRAGGGGCPPGVRKEMTMNYIDRIAIAIFNADPDGPYTATRLDELDEDDLALARIYAVLALTKGEDVTNKDVHDAWSAWRTASFPDHRSIVPYEELAPAVQQLDSPYAEAIQKVAMRLHEVLV